MAKIKVQMFKEVKGLCFIKCPICKSDIIVKDDDWSKCKHARDNKHIKNKKYVFRLRKIIGLKKDFPKLYKQK